MDDTEFNAPGMSHGLAFFLAQCFFKKLCCTKARRDKFFGKFIGQW